MGVLFAFVFAGFIIWMISTVVAGSARRKRLMAHLGQLVAGTPNNSNTQVAGQREGIETTFALTSRGSGSSQTTWTEVEATLPSGCTLELHLSRHGWFEKGKIERGELVDVIVGDPPFDQAFLIEAAPADVVRQLLDAPTRAFLLEHRVCDLDTFTKDGKARLKLGVRGWLEDPAKAQRAIDIAAGIAGRVRDAYAAVDAASTQATTAHVGSPYRPEVEAAPQREARDARASEVARLKEKRAGRARYQGQLLIGFYICIAIFFVVFVLSL